MQQFLIALVVIIAVAAVTWRVRRKNARNVPQCLEKVMQAAAPCPEGIDIAVLQKLHPFLHNFNDFNPGTNEILDNQQAEIDRIRKWANESVTDPCTRSEYNRWLNFYQRGMEEARTELKTHSRQKETETYGRKIDSERKKALSLNVPAPPRASN